MGQSGRTDSSAALTPQVPIAPVALHAPDGRSFLGVRRRRDGMLELVYDRFGVRHSVWEVVQRNIDIDSLNEACRRSVLAQDCLATLYACLAAHGVRIECKEDRLGDRP
jgi:hypothetical protein